MATSEPPRLWYLTRYIPRRWALKLIAALTWAEFDVTRAWLVPDEADPRGFRVEHIPLSEVSGREHAARVMLELM